MIPIIVFYHCYLFTGNPPKLLQSAFNVVAGQMRRMVMSGLANSATEIIVGVNGSDESEQIARAIVPPKAKIVFHGLGSRCENPTILLIEQWLKFHKEEAHILYFHAKGSSYEPHTKEGQYDARWRECMMKCCVDGWRQRIADLFQVEASGCHWLSNQAEDRSQKYFAGTFFWSRASFLRTLPSIMDRPRIKMSGLGAYESRYEAEVWIGNGRMPTFRDYHPGHPMIHQ